MRSRPAPGTPLTVSEVRILQLVSEGRTNTQIATHIGTTEYGIKSHLVHIGAKLGFPTRAGMVGAGFRQGILR